MPNSLSAWLESYWKPDEEILELTNQFYVTLRAYFARVQDKGNGRSSETYREVEKLLEPSRLHNWSDCYEVEQLLVNLYDDEMLRAELDLRKIEARNLRSPLADYYAKAAGEAKTPEQQRTLLARLLNDLQWRYTVNESKRRFSKALTRRTGLMFLGAFLGFALLSFSLWNAWLRNCSDMTMFHLAVLAGAWGATFSMLTSLKSRIDACEVYDLKSMSAFVMLLSRALIGAGAAAIFYFFLRSELVKGAAFPDLNGAVGAASECDVGSKNVALLVVWSFLAGFSEKLVPGLLAKTEGKMEGGADRFRPTESPSVPAVAEPQKGGVTATAQAAGAAATAQQPQAAGGTT